MSVDPATGLPRHKPHSGLNTGTGGTDGPKVQTTERGRTVLTVDPFDNVVLGVQNICRYLGINSVASFYKWVDDYGLPAVKRPDGMWMTTMTAVDEWLWIAHEADSDNRKKTRPTNLGPQAEYEKAKRRLEQAEQRLREYEAREPDRRMTQHPDYKPSGEAGVHSPSEGS